uniref:Nose resistant to fluoxetine protein 6-like n=1 Tax=Acrobeloides nanus TaxID=290746 RepID=A0A914DQP3_9BILA
MFSQQEDPCVKNFWVNLLYLNNYVHWKTECYGVSWYLATDMQMFAFTPLLLIPLALNKFVGLAVAGALFILSSAANIFTIYHYHYGPTYQSVGWVDPEEKHPEQYAVWIYAAPYIRCQVYIMGLLVGYFMQMTPKLKINKILNIVFWALSTSSMLFVVLCLYRYNNNHELSLFGRAMYSAFSKPIWAIGLSWIVVSCYYGYGGITVRRTKTEKMSQNGKNTQDAWEAEEQAIQKSLDKL